MAYGETFQIGDRIAYDNFEGPSFGTISKIMGSDAYEIEWDDGFNDRLSSLGVFKGYRASEIDHVCRCVYPEQCACPDYAKGHS